MTLRIFNTLSLRKQVFRAEGEVVKMFLCGPTIYDYCHLGHARTFVAFDIIARYLRYCGYKTKVVMNVSDISEEMFKNAEREEKSRAEYSSNYFRFLLEDLSALDVRTIDVVVRASENIPEMIDWIQRLLEQGAAYVTQEGVFLDTSRVRGYGRLSHQSRAELALRRLELSPSKKNPEDFFIWKVQDRRDTWNSPWGKGLPGQHIEDAAASTKHLGLSYDINGGGDELVFPHHEATKAQIESVTGSPMCRYWLHTGMLLVGERKMSKSMKNAMTIREALAKYDAPALRLYLASTHYRKPLRFKHTDLKKAFRLSHRIRNSVKKMKSATRLHRRGTDTELDRTALQLETRFTKAMDNDFDTENAIKELTSFIDYLTRTLLSKKPGCRGLSRALDSVVRLSNVLGIL